MKRRVLLLSVVLIVLLGGVYGIYWWMRAPEEAGKEPPPNRPIYNVESITTDLAVGPGGRRNWVQVDVQLECRDADALSAVEENWVVIRNELLTIFRSLEAESLKGEEGMDRLRSSIIRRTNEILDDAELTDVFLLTIIVH